MGSSSRTEQKQYLVTQCIVNMGFTFTGWSDNHRSIDGFLGNWDVFIKNVYQWLRGTSISEAIAVVQIAGKSLFMLSLWGSQNNLAVYCWKLDAGLDGLIRIILTLEFISTGIY